NHKKFRTVPEAIRFLRSGEKFPKNILEILGYSDSEKSIFNRLFRLTASCIKNHEVCSIG
ncbi:hypothetical protein LJC23_07530, partial [Desulfovibrio sp. OttesenSCG-928-I05]|nr:hypothetical protein [Desulfovibrio sp. OttesenSCG-928-I05]